MWFAEIVLKYEMPTADDMHKLITLLERSKRQLRPLLLTWFNFNPSMDK